MFADVITSAFDSQKAYNISTHGSFEELLFSEIYGEILVAVGQKLHHVEWYSASYEPTNFEEYKKVYSSIKEISNFLKSNKYTCLISQFTPSLERSTYRVRLYITWKLTNELENNT